MFVFSLIATDAMMISGGGANEELNGNMSHWIEIFSISYSLLPFIVILHSIRGVYMECKQNDQKKKKVKSSNFLTFI